MKYTRDEVMNAMREHIAESRKDMGLDPQFSDEDYIALGIAVMAFNKLEPLPPIMQPKTKKGISLYMELAKFG